MMTLWIWFKGQELHFGKTLNKDLKFFKIFKHFILKYKRYIFFAFFSISRQNTRSHCILFSLV